MLNMQEGDKAQAFKLQVHNPRSTMPSNQQRTRKEWKAYLRLSKRKEWWIKRASIYQEGDAQPRSSYHPREECQRNERKRGEKDIKKKVLGWEKRPSKGVLFESRPCFSPWIATVMLLQLYCYSRRSMTMLRACFWAVHFTGLLIFCKLIMFMTL